jgi:TPR repeat protein
MLRAVLPFLIASSVATAAFAQTPDAALPATFSELKTQAEAGNADAQLAMGRAHLDGGYGGKSVSRDVNEARTWFARAAEADTSETGIRAAYEMAQTYYPAEIEDAEKWFLKAAASGKPGPAHYLCDIYRSSALANWDKALIWCRKSAEYGRTAPYAGMAESVELGMEGQTASLPQAVEMYVELAGWLDGPSTLRLADLYHGMPVGSENDVTALRYTRMAMGVEPKPYMTRLAQYYESGRGVAVDAKEAERLYWHAAQLGSTEAVTWVSAHSEVTQASLDAETVPQEQFAGQPLRYKGRKAINTNGYYPERAAEDEVDGTSTFECRITATGDLQNCVSSQETPRGYGFALATVRAVTQADLYVSDTSQLLPYAGKLVRFRFTWKLE